MLESWWRAHELEVVADAVLVGLLAVVFGSLWLWHAIDRRRDRKRGGPDEPPSGP